jgi:hypothetical protein
MSPARASHAELTVGVIAPHDLVELIMLSGVPAGYQAAAGSSAVAGPSRRLLAASYREEQEAADKVASLGASIDSCLFASRLPQEYARRAGVLNVPSACIQLAGSPLYGALLRASRDHGSDLARTSIDTISRADVDDAFAELGIASADVHVREEPAGPAALAAFHEKLWRKGQSTMAFTSVPAVAARLTAVGAPALILRPTASAIRSALRTATLLAGNRRLEEAQLAVILVEVPALRDSARRATPRQARLEMQLSVHRLLLQEAQRMHASVSPASDHGFLVTATRGSLATATSGLRVPPFAERVRSELGIMIEVGIGTGRTAHDAEARARSVLGRSQAGTGLGEIAPQLTVPVQPGGAAARRSPRGLTTLARLADKLPASESGLAVDAETAGNLLGVTPRTARRLLHALVEDGLAWPLPPSRTPQPGRPRQVYRLVTEQLDRGAARRQAAAGVQRVTGPGQDGRPPAGPASQVTVRRPSDASHAPRPASSGLPAAPASRIPPRLPGTAQRVPGVAPLAGGTAPLTPAAPAGGPVSALRAGNATRVVSPGRVTSASAAQGTAEDRDQPVSPPGTG